jgi:flavodoxin
MKPCIVYFSRTGNTKRLAEAIANQIEAPIFDIVSTEPTVFDSYDTIVFGTPVEGASPAKEIQAFVERLPNGQGKKVGLFCTYRIFGNERAMKKLEKILASKEYEVILKTSKKGMKPEEPADFSKILNEVQKALP